MRIPVMAGNWKMYKTPAETTAFFEKFRPLVEKSSHCEIVICPPFTNLHAAVAAVKGSNIRIGAQNIGWAKEGAFTGEISGPMIVAVGASFPAARRSRPAKLNTGAASKTNDAPATADSALSAISSTTARAKANGPALASTSKPVTEPTSPARRAARAAEPPM